MPAQDKQSKPSPAKKTEYTADMHANSTLVQNSELEEEDSSDQVSIEDQESIKNEEEEEE